MCTQKLLERKTPNSAKVQRLRDAEIQQRGRGTGEAASPDSVPTGYRGDEMGSSQIRLNDEIEGTVEKLLIP